MTAEVALMNQHVLVLAADSATTVTAYPKGKKEQRFFKGANKLFQLSDDNPVGLMLYSQATLHEIPWEIVVKEFRRSLGKESFDSLSGYGPRFFDFVAGQKALFPDEVRASALRDVLLRDAFLEWRLIRKKLEKGRGDLPTLVEQRLHDRREKEAVPPFSNAQINGLVTSHLETAIEVISDNKDFVEIEDLSFVRDLAEIVIRDIALDHVNLLPHTGIVIGGYGDRDFFPSLEVFDCYGFLDHQLVVHRNARLCKAVSRTEPVAIEPFATASMINTFRMGIGPDAFASVQEATENALRRMIEKVIEITSPAGGPWDFDDVVKEIKDRHGTDWFNQSFEEHYSPLARVVASLPVVDLAALAKSLIELQSLKERVTQPTESVGGPIDVAAISRHDGFIWIERKHYFRPELNPRFFARRK